MAQTWEVSLRHFQCTAWAFAVGICRRSLRWQLILRQGQVNEVFAAHGGIGNVAVAGCAEHRRIAQNYGCFDLENEVTVSPFAPYFSTQCCWTHLDILLLPSDSQLEARKSSASNTSPPEFVLVALFSMMLHGWRVDAHDAVSGVNMRPQTSN